MITIVIILPVIKNSFFKYTFSWKSVPEGAFLILIVVIIFLTLMSISNECEIPCRTLLGHVEPQRANVRGQVWVEKRQRGEEKWEEKLIIYSPQVLDHYWDCAVLFTICKMLTEPLASAARPSSQGQTQTQLCSQTTVCPPTPVNPLGEWTQPLFTLTWAASYMLMHIVLCKVSFLRMVLNLILL